MSLPSARQGPSAFSMQVTLFPLQRFVPRYHKQVFFIFFAHLVFPCSRLKYFFSSSSFLKLIYCWYFHNYGHFSKQYCNQRRHSWRMKRNHSWTFSRVNLRKNVTFELVVKMINFTKFCFDWMMMIDWLCLFCFSGKILEKVSWKEKVLLVLFTV